MPELTDWLSRLLELMPVTGQIEHRCFFGAPWQIAYDTAPVGEIPYHIVLAGSAVLHDETGHVLDRLQAGDILFLPHGSAHVLNDGSGAAPAPSRKRVGLALTIDENDGAGERLDMLCGRFVLSAVHERLVRAYLPSHLVVAAKRTAATARPGSGEQLAGLVGLMRFESADENLGGRAMLNALSTAMFALTLRLASEAAEAPDGLLALAGHPRLAPALTAIFNQPAHPWTLPELAALCAMSRATFIRQFQQRLGRSAADLLTDIRMTVAANQLRQTSASTGAVAEDAGYQSEAAFQRVFKQHMGLTPAQYRRQAQAVPSPA
jgi:AraC family transcriptional activator of mtrCDE